MARGGSVNGAVHTLRELFGSSFYLIDYYQREYEWSAGDVRTLVTDLVEAFRLDRPHGRRHRRRDQGEQYFLGPFVFVQHSGDERFLVDGQQRFTTLHLIFLHLYRQAEARGDRRTADRLRRVIHEEWDGPHPRFRIKIDERREALEAIFFDRDYAPDTEATLSVRTLWQRACELNELLDKAMEEDDGAEFADWLLTRVVLVGIQAPSRESGLRIFESMNDRGARLTPVDLLKSFLLSGVGPEGRDKLNVSWRSMLATLTVTRDDADAPRVFLKAALIAHHAELDDASDDLQEIDAGLHLWVKRHQNRLELDGEDRFHEFVEKLLELARHHRTLLAATMRPHRHDGLAPVFYNAVNGLHHQLILMLAAIRPHDTSIAVKAKAGLVAAYLDRCFVERILRDQPIDRDEQDADVRELVPLLKQCTAAEDVRCLLAERLTGGSFTEVLTFGRRGNNRSGVHYLLARLTDHVERGCGGADRVEEYLSPEHRFHIEHLWANHPERLADEIPDPADFRALRERLGALVLLPARENESYRDKPLPEKLPFYARQNHLTAVLSSPAHITNNPVLRSFVKAEGLEDVFHSFGATAPMKTSVEVRGELYRRLCRRIWGADRLGLGGPEPDVDRQETAAMRPATGKPLATDLGRMVAAQVVAANSVLRAEHRGKRYEATVEPDGAVRLASGDRFGRADDAGATVCGTKRCQGMALWHVQLPNGSWISLRDLRERARTDGRLGRTARRSRPS